MSVSLLTKSTQVFCFLMDAALHAFVLAMLVLLLCRLLRGWLRPQFKILLWALVLVRLVLPIAPASKRSLFEHLPSLDVAQTAFEKTSLLHTELEREPAGSQNHAAGIANTLEVDHKSPHRSNRSGSWLLGAHSYVWNAVAMVWLAGALLLTVRLTGQTWLLYHKRSQWSKPNDRLLRVWEQCLNELDVRKPIEIRLADDGTGPGVFGLFRPCVVVPSTLVEDEKADGLRHVLLHELMHVARGDVYWKCVAHAVTIVHWFHPLSWRISRYLLDEIELACDADVLRRFDEQARQDYGHTVLHVAATQRKPAELALVGFAQQDNVNKRIYGIADFRSPSILLTLASIVLVLCLAVAGLTMRKAPFSPPANEMAAALAAKKSGVTGTDNVALPWPVESEREAAKAIRECGGFYGLDGDNHITSVNMVYHNDWAKFGGDMPEDAVEQTFRVDNSNMEIKPAIEALSTLPRLKKLLVHDSQLTDEMCHIVGNLSSLESLYAWDAEAIGDQGIEQLVGLTNLKYVHLSNSRIGDDGLKTLANLPSIEELSLQGNTFSDKGLQAIRNSSRIKKAILGSGGSTFSEPAVLAMLEMRSLEELGVQGTSLSPHAKQKFNQANVKLFGADNTSAMGRINRFGRKVYRFFF